MTKNRTPTTIASHTRVDSKIRGDEDLLVLGRTSGAIEIEVDVLHEDLALGFPVVGSAAPRSAQTTRGIELPITDVRIGGVTYKSLRVPVGSHRISITVDG